MMWLISARSLQSCMCMTGRSDSDFMFLDTLGPRVFSSCVYLCSCVAMAWEHPRVEKHSLEWRVMFYLDIMFTAIFGIEFIMKSFALSFQIYIKTLTNKVGFSQRAAPLSCPHG